MLWVCWEQGAELPWSWCIPMSLCMADTHGLCPISSTQQSSSGHWAGVRCEGWGASSAPALPSALGRGFTGCEG